MPSISLARHVNHLVRRAKPAPLHKNLLPLMTHWRNKKDKSSLNKVVHFPSSEAPPPAHPLPSVQLLQDLCLAGTQCLYHGVGAGALHTSAKLKINFSLSPLFFLTLWAFSLALQRPTSSFHHAAACWIPQLHLPASPDPSWKGLAFCLFHHPSSSSYQGFTAHPPCCFALRF